MARIEAASRLRYSCNQVPKRSQLLQISNSAASDVIAAKS
jgi:hypothetical protein